MFDGDIGQFDGRVLFTDVAVNQHEIPGGFQFL
jgi:hypothetical protein